MSYIRDVGRWLQAHGQRDAYVLSDRWKAAVVPAHPYLLNSDEIEAFFAAAATLNAASPWRWQAVAFFTLMHSCGLRTGETRLLRPEHVPQDRVLVAQQQDLGSLGCVVTGENGEPGELLPEDQVDESQSHANSTRIFPFSVTACERQVSGVNARSRHPPAPGSSASSTSCDPM
jgi:integrase